MTAIQKPNSLEVFQRINQQLSQSADVGTILDRLYQNPQNFFSNIHSQLFDIFQHEHQFQMQEIVKIAEEQQNQIKQDPNQQQQQSFDFLETYTLNSDIFKQSIMVILGLIVDDIHTYFNQGVQNAVNQIKYGDDQMQADPEFQKKVEEQKMYYLQKLNQEQGGDLTPSQFHASLGNRSTKNQNIHLYSPENPKPRDNTQVNKTLSYLKQFYQLDEIEENKLMKNKRQTPLESHLQSQQQLNAQEQLEIAQKLSQQNINNQSQNQSQQNLNQQVQFSNNNSNRQSLSGSLSNFKQQNLQQQQQEIQMQMQQQENQENQQQQFQQEQQQQEENQQYNNNNTANFKPSQSLQKSRSNQKSKQKQNQSQNLSQQQSKVEPYGKIKNEKNMPQSFQSKGATFSRAERLQNLNSKDSPGVGSYDINNNFKKNKLSFGKSAKTSIFEENSQKQQGPDTMYDPNIRYLSTTKINKK